MQKSTVIIGVIIIAIVVVMIYLLNMAGLLTTTKTFDVGNGTSQLSSDYVYGFSAPGSIKSIQANFSVITPPNSCPADGVAILLGENSVQYTGGVYQCRINSSACKTYGLGPSINFNGILAGIELYKLPQNVAQQAGIQAPPYAFICSASGQCVFSPISSLQPGQNYNGTLTLTVTNSGSTLTVNIPSAGLTASVTSPFTYNSNLGEVIVTTGSNYATWTINSVQVTSNLF